MTITKRILMLLLGIFVLSASSLLSGCIVHDDQWHHDHDHDWHDDHHDDYDHH
jgi:hypothetical protein